MSINEKIEEWYKLTQEIKVVVRDKHKGQLEEIANQMKDDFLLEGSNEIE